ncbi:MAG: tyrosine-protein phosphatase [Ilumatobacteraceae bacterium]
MSLDDLHERLLPLRGVFNARDIGGYATPRGRIGWGRVIRTAGLDCLDDAGRGMLAQLGVRTVVDLRREDERVERPNALGTLEVATVHVSIGSAAPAAEREVITLEEAYLRIVTDAGAALATAVGELARPGALPAIIHCTAGKDRTGIVVAFLLALLGVDDEVIAADYAVSENLLGDPFVERIGGDDPEILARLLPLLGSPPAMIRWVFEQVRTSHGGVEDYLVAHGLDPAAPDRLRVALLEDPR